MKIVFRKAQPDDITKIGELFSHVYEPYSNRWSVEKSSEFLGWLYNRCTELAFVAEDNGRIVGAYLAALKPWWDGPHIIDGEIFVEPTYQHQGIGLRLTELLLEEAEKRYGAVKIDAVVYTNLGRDKVLEWHKQNGRQVKEGVVIITGLVTDVLERVRKRRTRN